MSATIVEAPAAHLTSTPAATAAKGRSNQTTGRQRRVEPVTGRVRRDGKFFRLGEEKFYVKGVAYGPFEPNAAGQPFASPEQTAADFALIRELGANVIRVYHVPARWFLDLAAEHKLKVLVDIPWQRKLCFLDSAQYRAEACDAVRRAVYACGRHPAVFAFSVANEIPPDIVRWSGARPSRRRRSPSATAAGRCRRRRAAPRGSRPCAPRTRGGAAAGPSRGPAS